MTLTRKPFVFEGRIVPDSWVVLYEGCEVGRIGTTEANKELWQWSIKSKAIQPNRANASTFEEARAEFERQWDTLSDYAKNDAKRRDWWLGSV